MVTNLIQSTAITEGNLEMIETVNYYVVKTEENKEYYVSSKIKGIFGK